MQNLKIPFAKVPIIGNEIKYLKEVLKSGWLTTASKALMFEQKFSEYVNAKYACAVNSCTAALHLGIEALGVKPGDKVFVQSMTFTASAEVIRYLGAHPVFLDTEYGSNLITPDILKEAIEEHPDVKFLIVVHYGGQAAEMTNLKGNGILDICRQNNIKILEDAAHAFPSRQNGRMIGTLGDITCFSFYANKTITTGEGGMLTTNNEAIYKRVKTMRLHGIDRDIWNRFTSDKPSWEYDVIDAGYKYNMPDINAAIGLAQLEYAEEFRKERQRVAEYYLDKLSTILEIDLPKCNVSLTDHAWHLFPIILNSVAKISRNHFIEKLSEAGIGTSVHYKPLHRMTYYKEIYSLELKDFPNCEKTWKGTVSLPIFPYMKHHELDYIYNSIVEILHNNS
ncbi:MAG: DegT/DnrJ/EryC1/StrS family aminotransferase [Bacteroidetes bacterium]|nr:MAG: DegT/DnrJ/EryC1/StrS family aminotransferase [Bacteroidota bacterium]